jgi:hypothetical protein
MQLALPLDPAASLARANPQFSLTPLAELSEREESAPALISINAIDQRATFLRLERRESDARQPLKRAKFLPGPHTNQEH